jgi:hypothetical protein
MLPSGRDLTVRGSQRSHRSGYPSRGGTVTAEYLVAVTAVLAEGGGMEKRRDGLLGDCLSMQMVSGNIDCSPLSSVASCE